ncbi:MAG: hypothetical protein M3348_03715 [Acidobacteriota bacterium]|nr:hypothetical protein [Acidobacteriota bacterium]
MLKRIVSALTMSALILVTTAAPASAQSAVTGGVEAGASPAASAPAGPSTRSAQPGAGLKEGMLKLVAEAKAAKGVPAAPPRQQPAPRNGFSSGRKVAVGVGVAAAVIIIVIVLSRRDDSDRFVAPPCPPGQLCM